MPVRIIVCGGRDYADRARVFEVLDHILLTRGISEIIQGEHQAPIAGPVNGH